MKRPGSHLNESLIGGHRGAAIGVGPPALRDAIGTQATGMLGTCGQCHEQLLGRLGFAGDITPPASNGAAGTQAADVHIAGSKRHESRVRRHHQLSVAVVTPAHGNTIRAQATAVVCTHRYRRENAFCRRRAFPSRIAAPARHGTILANRATVVATRCQRHHPSAPIRHGAGTGLRQCRRRPCQARHGQPQGTEAGFPHRTLVHHTLSLTPAKAGFPRSSGKQGGERTSHRWKEPACGFRRSVHRYRVRPARPGSTGCRSRRSGPSTAACASSSA